MSERTDHPAPGHKPGVTWPTDHLVDAERRLARLWRAFDRRDDEEEWVEGDDEREAILYGVADALHRARDAAAALIPEAPMGSFHRLAQLVGYLRDDLHLGIAVNDVIGGSASYATRIEEAVEQTAAAWEEAEWKAGRPKMNREQAVGDVAERLSWDKPL